MPSLSRRRPYKLLSVIYILHGSESWNVNQKFCALWYNVRTTMVVLYSLRSYSNFSFLGIQSKNEDCF